MKPSSELASRSERPLLDVIRETPNMRSFFKSLWRSREMQRLFFAHRAQLFPSHDDGRLQFSAPFLFFDTLPDDDDEREIVEGLVHAPLEVTAEKRDAMSARFQPDGDRLMREAQTVLSLLAVRFFQANPALANIIQRTDRPLYMDVAKAISKHPTSIANVFDDLEDIKRIWEADSPIGKDPALIGLIKSGVDYVRRSMRAGSLEVADGQVELIDFAANFVDMSSNMIPLYLAGHQHIDALLAAQGLSHPEYQKCLTQLYLKRVIENVFTAFICGSCHDDPVTLTSTSRLSPDQHNIGCPKCSKPTFAAGMYRIHHLLQRAIASKDGLLAVAAEWLLSESGASVKTGAYMGNRETDILFEVGKKSFLLECKMYKTGKDSEAVAMNLDKAVNQACKTANDIVASGGKLDTVVILTNYQGDTHASELASALRKRRKSTAKYNVVAVDPMAFAELVQRAKE